MRRRNRSLNGRFGRRNSDPLASLGNARRFQTTEWNDQVVIVKDMPGQEKMSEVLLDFAAPLLKLSDEMEWKTTVLDLAIAAWNFSLLPPEDQASATRDISESLDSSEAEEVFEFLLERKAERYPENHRFVVEYHIRQDGDAVKFNVISTPKLPEG